MSVFTIQHTINRLCNTSSTRLTRREKKGVITTMWTMRPEEVIDFDPCLRGPFTCLVVGPTGCGKTQLIFKLIENANQLITPPVQHIVYCYGQWQNQSKQFENKVTFHKGLLPKEQLFPPATQQASSSQHTLLIIDDLLDKEDTSLVRDIFIKGSHHNNIGVIFVKQNLFLPYKDYRTLSLNANYIVVFKNPRDTSQINALARQAFVSKPTFLTTVYNQELLTDTHTCCWTSSNLHLTSSECVTASLHLRQPHSSFQHIS